MRIEMTVKEWETLMLKYTDEYNKSLFEIGKVDENILGVKHLVFLSDGRLYGYDLKEHMEKFYNADEISDKKVSVDIKVEYLNELYERRVFNEI